MSYDLYFKPRSGSFSEELFYAYFCERPNYKCEGSQAWYGNEDTGVYFVFELQAAQLPEEDDDEPLEHFPIALNINYLRPSYFIFEAEPEVTAFVKHFDLLVSDPQMEGMGDGEYNAEKLLSGWNCGNEFGYTSVLRDENNRSRISHLPAEQLHNAWRWNWTRTQVQARVGESKFVPRIMFMNLGGSTVTAAVWPDGIPVVVTRVDYLCVPRKELAPTKFFRKKEDTTFVAWDEALPVLLKHGTQSRDGSISLNYMTPPPDVVKFVQSLPVENRAVAGLSADRVLDREIYERSIV
ncbi:hypothetical protein ACDA63_18755 [Uliginosibacterium sp. sgz301328]|uniref:hypothetical protein n=1 Tax=Uliginosibacterium sp. sgz301328 TaxID=3243764 RepID=UPI00359D1737